MWKKWWLLLQIRLKIPSLLLFLLRPFLKWPKGLCCCWAESSEEKRFWMNCVEYKQVGNLWLCSWCSGQTHGYLCHSTIIFLLLKKLPSSNNNASGCSSVYVWCTVAIIFYVLHDLATTINYLSHLLQSFSTIYQVKGLFLTNVLCR